MGNKIPKISNDRLDTTVINTSVANVSDKTAHAFIKDREAVKAIAIRFPISLHRAIKKVAFEEGVSINSLVVTAIRKFLKE